MASVDRAAVKRLPVSEKGADPPLLQELSNKDIQTLTANNFKPNINALP